MSNTTPVQVGGQALKYLSDTLRKWSGWRDASLSLTAPPKEAGSPWAATHMVKRQVWVNVDELSLNPHRVLRTANPFRLRQEAIISGAMMHEAAHARFSTWKPRTEEDMAAFTHSDGTKPTQATLALATLMEEPRIETRMRTEASKVGVLGLEWTMQAMALHLFPLDGRLRTQPDQQIMDLIAVWALRAGRRYGQYRAEVERERANSWWVPNAHANLAVKNPAWVTDFDQMLHNELVDYRISRGDDHADALHAALNVGGRLRDMILWEEPGEVSPDFIDYARSILNFLFPETPDGEGPTPEAQGVCGMSMGDDEGDEEGDGSGSGESDEEGDEEGDGSDSDSGSGEADEDEEESGTAVSKDLQDVLNQSRREEEGEVKKGMSEPPPLPEPDDSPSDQRAGSSGGGSGAKAASTEGTTIRQFDQPNRDDRALARSAEQFLRRQINPTETSAHMVNDSPSSSVDATALSVWKAGGRTQAPRFFAQTRRDVTPSPPVKIAVLVDISASMDVLAGPSARLSWALSTAAVDLRNFAGRGSQVESTLIHWGDEAKVVQEVGEILPGIGRHTCPDGTEAMGAALALVDQQIPGFFDPKEPGREENRLIVQFTDWGLQRSSYVLDPAREWLTRGLTNGVKMLSVVPPRVHRLTLGTMDTIIPEHLRHLHTVVSYDPNKPDGVWDEAASALR